MELIYQHDDAPSIYTEFSRSKGEAEELAELVRAEGTRVLAVQADLTKPDEAVKSIHAAVCGAGTLGQMSDNIRVAQSFKPLSPTELADVRKRAVVGTGVYTGTGMEYWKKVV